MQTKGLAMKQEHIKSIFESYLVTTGCEIHHSDNDCIQVKLSVEADRAIANRPYYWAFIDNMQQNPAPLSFTFWFSPPHPEVNLPLEHTLSELITVGNGKLDLIIQQLQAHGRFTMLYEQPLSETSVDAYDPWLNVNYSLHFKSYSNRNDIYSIGLSLKTGEIIADFMDQIAPTTFSSTIAPSTMIKPSISIGRAKQLVQIYIHNQLVSSNHSWAIHASELESHEEARLKKYYQEQGDSELLLKRTSEIRHLYSPSLHINIINCGIFHFLNHLRQ
jgi:hypothetical protein